MFDTLDVCVQPDLKKVAFVTSVRGAGRTALLEAWAKRDDRPGTTIMIELVPPPAASIPMIAVLASRLWYQILHLHHAAIGLTTTATLPKPMAENIESWFTVRQILNLFHQHILPMLNDLHVTAIVVDNAQLMDKATLQWLLDLRSPPDPWRRVTPQRALIIGAQLRAKPSVHNAFVKTVHTYPQLRLAWHEQTTLDVLTITEFFMVWARALERNLQARYDDRVAPDERKLITAGYWQKTGGNWWAIEQLIEIYHEELGPQRGQPYRIMTHDVIKRVHARIEKIPWTITEEAEEDTGGGRKKRKQD